MRPAADYRRVAELHASNLDRSFLAELGIPFLTSLYRAIDASEEAVLITESRGGKIAGFVTGAPSLGPIYRSMLNRIFVWGPSLALRLLSLRRIRRVLDILTHSEPENDALPDMELLSIAVDPEARGTGVAKALYDGLITYCRAKNIPAFRIMVGEDLAPAHRFYEKMGATPSGSMELHPGEASIIYIHDIIS